MIKMNKKLILKGGKNFGIRKTLLYPSSSSSSSSSNKSLDIHHRLHIHRRLCIHSSLSKLTFWSSFFLAFILFLFILSLPSPFASPCRALGDSWGSSHWEKCVAKSARRSTSFSLTMLVTCAAGFASTHISLALKRRNDDVLELDNFNHYYDLNLKSARQPLGEWGCDSFALLHKSLFPAIILLAPC